MLVRSGERKAPKDDSSSSKKDKKDDNASGGGKSPVSVGATSPSRGDNKHGRGREGGGGKNGKKDWVRFDGAAMLLSSAGWSDDEDEEKEELITSEIEKFRQKQVCVCVLVLVFETERESFCEFLFVCVIFGGIHVKKERDVSKRFLSLSCIFFRPLILRDLLWLILTGRKGQEAGGRAAAGAAAEDQGGSSSGEDQEGRREANGTS